MAAESEVEGKSQGTEGWWDRQKKEASTFAVDDCAECRYVAGFGMYGAALYVAYTGVQRQKLRGAKTLWGAVPALITSALLAGLGTARLLRINPFSSSGQETGIDFVHRAFQKLSQPADVTRNDAENKER